MFRSTRTGTVFVAASNAEQISQTETDFLCDGTDDDVEIQAAVDSLPDGGGAVILSEGLYTLSAVVTRSIDNVTILGMGMGTRLVNNASDNIFSDGGQAGWAFLEFDVDAGDLTDSGAGVVNDYWLDGSRQGAGGVSHVEDHDHDGSPTQQLDEANTHQNPTATAHHSNANDHVSGSDTNDHADVLIAHNIDDAAHDTDATGTELNELTDASETILHSHAGGATGSAFTTFTYVVDPLAGEGSTVTLTSGDTYDTYQTVQAAIAAGDTAGGDFSIYVVKGVFNETITFPDTIDATVTLVGAGQDLTFIGPTGAGSSDGLVTDDTLLTLYVSNLTLRANDDEKSATGTEKGRFSFDHVTFELACTLDNDGGTYTSCIFEGGYDITNLIAPINIRLTDCWFTGGSSGNFGWTQSFSRHWFVNCRFDTDVEIAITAEATDIYWIGCNFGVGNIAPGDFKFWFNRTTGILDMTFIGCMFPSPDTTNGMFHILACAADSLLKFTGNKFLREGSETNPHVKSDDVDLRVVSSGNFFDDGEAYPVYLGAFKDSSFGPEAPSDFDINISGSSSNNVYYGTKASLTGEVGTLKIFDIVAHDTTGTGAELTTLTDGSNADSLHVHAVGDGAGVQTYTYVVDANASDDLGQTITLSGGSTSILYQVIGTAITAAEIAGGKISIYVTPGTYAEDLTIDGFGSNDDLTIIGAGRDQTFIGLNAADTAAAITYNDSNDIFLKDLTLLGGTSSGFSLLTGTANSSVHCDNVTFEEDVKGDFTISSFRGCIFTSSYTLDTGFESTSVFFNDCVFDGESLWANGFINTSTFTNCRWSATGKITCTNANINDTHFVGCDMRITNDNWLHVDSAIAQLQGITFTGCNFSTPQSTGTIYIETMQATNGTSMLFSACTFITSGNSPQIQSDDTDFNVSIIGCDFISNANPVVVGSFTDSTFGPNSPPDFDIDVTAGGGGNVYRGTKEFLTGKVGTIAFDNRHDDNNVSLIEDFDTYTAFPATAAEHPWTLLSGSDGSADDPVIVAAKGTGHAQLVTGAAASYVMSTDGSQIVGSNPWSADMGTLVMEVRLKAAAITALQMCVGFTDIASLEMPVTISGTTITTVADNVVCAVFDNNQTTDQWYFVGSASTTDATGNAITGVPPVAATFEVIRIEIDGLNDARLYLDGVLEGTLTANAVTAATSIFPTVAITGGDATQTIDIDYIRVWATRP